MRVLLVAATLVALALTARAESDGPYVHGTVRKADQKLIVCLDRTVAVEAAESVNQALLGLRGEIEAATDDAARQAIYETRLYPSPGWQVLMDAIYQGECDLIESSDHISQKTILVGPEQLVPLGAAHSVVESRMLYGEDPIPRNVWIVTTETVPPPGE